MIAAVDESVKMSGSGLYVVGMAFVAPDEVGRIRADLRRLLKPRQQRFHWAKEGRDQRNRMLDYIHEAATGTAAYVTAEPWRRHDTARGRCLRAAISDHGKGLTEIVIESRDEHLDRRDRQIVAAAQRQGLLPAELEYTFCRPKDDPLVWMADAVAGAVLAESSKGPKGRAYIARLRTLAIHRVV